MSPGTCARDAAVFTGAWVLVVAGAVGMVWVCCGSASALLMLARTALAP
jgi:hypothetical protein